MLKKTLIYAILCSVAVVSALLFAGCGEDVPQKKLRMVTEATFPPYEFRKGKQIVGIDPEIVGEIARRNGYTLIIEDMSFNSVIAAVQTGKADVAASGITVTEERKKMVSFSTSYVTAAQVVIVRKDGNVSSIDDLKKCRIGVQHGTTGDSYVSKNINAPERYSDAAMTVVALISGKVDAVVLDNAPAETFVRQNPDKIYILSQPLVAEHYAYAISKSRPELLQMFNSTLAEMKKDGSLKKILDHYLLEKNDSKLPVSVGNAGKKSMWHRFRDALKTNFLDNLRYQYLLHGFYITLIVSLFSVILGVALGFLVAVIRTAADQTGKFKVLNLICKIYLTVIRGTPVVVQLLIIYFVICNSMAVNKIVVAIIAFGFNSGAYVAEIIRSGIMSIDRGQFEAGRSLGLSYNRTMIHIILPQAFKNVLPALGNEFIVLLKETSVSGYIALEDLTKGGDIIRSQTYNAFMPLMAVAMIYLAVVMLFSKLLTLLERRLKKNE